MTVPCSPNRLLWEALPDGLALYPFGGNPSETWLTDDAVMEQIDRLDGPRVYLDLGRTKVLSGRALGRICRLLVRVRSVRGQLVVCGVRPDILEVFEIVKLLPRRSNHPALPNWPIIHGEGMPNATRFPDPAWLVWERGIVGTLARTVMEDRDFDLMPVLGDALEDAGCIRSEVLEHCRVPGPHVRDCWVTRMLLETP